MGSWWRVVHIFKLPLQTLTLTTEANRRASYPDNSDFPHRTTFGSSQHWTPHNIIISTCCVLSICLFWFFFLFALFVFVRLLLIIFSSDCIYTFRSILCFWLWALDSALDSIHTQVSRFATSSICTVWPRRTCLCPVGVARKASRLPMWSVCFGSQQHQQQ